MDIDCSIPYCLLPAHTIVTVLHKVHCPGSSHLIFSHEPIQKRSEVVTDSILLRLVSNLVRNSDTNFVALLFCIDKGKHLIERVVLSLDLKLDNISIELALGLCCEIKPI